MKKSFLWLAGFLMLVGAGSCSSVYMPNTPSTPMLSAKGELSTSAHITLRGNATFNSAYAVTDHIGVLVSGAMMSNDSDKRDFRHNLLEAGGGYFTTFGPNQNRILEIYGGLGRGSSDRSFKRKENGVMVTHDRQEVSFNKFFAQVNYSSKKERSLRLLGQNFPLNYGTALRLSYLTMTEFIRNDRPFQMENNIFFEPVFYTRMTLTPNVQLQYTSGSNFGLKSRDYMSAGNSVLSVGVIINVGGLNLR